MTLATRRQLVVLLLLTLVWGLNWPVMKVGVSGLPGAAQSYPPLAFRAWSMWLGLPVLGAAVWWLKVPLALPRTHWKEFALLTLSNMLVWHVVIIVALQQLSSGRSAILGYTMPVFVALWGFWIWRERLVARQMLGVGAAALGVVLLLSSEFARFTGAPLAALAIVGAAAIWAWGTHLLRRSNTGLPLLALSFWMTAATSVVMLSLSLVFEFDQWRWPEPHVWAAVLYNAVLVFGFAHAAWFYLARSMPPVASSVSVMLIPVLGVFSGALLLGEPLQWQDWAACALMVLAIAAVLIRR